MSYSFKYIGKTEDVAAVVQSSTIEDSVKSFITARLALILPPDDFNTHRGDSVVVEGQGHGGSNDLIKIETFKMAVAPVPVTEEVAEPPQFQPQTEETPPPVP